MDKPRIASVDILRGLTIIAMILVNTPGTWSAVYNPLLHAPWHGLTPTDLVFPFFLFIVGISITFAYQNKSLDRSTLSKISIRSLKLFGLGFFLHWFLPYAPFFKDLESVRILGVLQRIAIVFFITAILALICNWKVLLTIAVSILLSYWILMSYVPLPDGTLPSFERVANNWALYVDSSILKQHMWKEDYDPEGLLSSIPAVATAILGVLTGWFLTSKTQEKVKQLIFTGLLLLLLGYLWHQIFPINKALWTSSFVLVSAGWALICLSGIYYLTDVRKVAKGGLFKQVGMNAITIFFLSSFITKLFYMIKINGNQRIHSWLFDHLYKWPFLELKFSSLLYALSVCLFYILLGHIMYRNKIIIKV